MRRVTLVLTLLLATTVARAQPSEDLEALRRAFESGLALEAAGDWAGALGRFTLIATARPTPQVRFHLARCLEKLGRWTEALGAYQLATREARAVGDEPMAGEIDAARAQLDARVPKLRLVRRAGASPYQLSLDGERVGEPSLGTTLRVDPGRHEVMAGTPSQSLREVFVLAPGEVRTVEVGEVPAMARPPAPPSRPGRTLAWAALGAGAAGVVGGVVATLLRAGTLEDLEAACVGNRCPPALESTASRGQALTAVAVGAFLVGAAGLGTGWALLLTSPSTAARSTVGATWHVRF